jgi:hypothetical protein
MTTANTYIDKLVEKVRHQISAEITKKGIQRFKTDVACRVAKTNSVKFFRWYFETTSNPKRLAEGKEMREFKTKWGLGRFVKDEVCDRIQENFADIVRLVNRDNLTTLYFEYFEQVGTPPTNQGCFFTKLVHTLKPQDYCPVDTIISGHFALVNESYFVRLCALSRAYKEWASENRNLIADLKNELGRDDKHQIWEQLEDLKLLDTIFLERERLGRK